MKRKAKFRVGQVVAMSPIHGILYARVVSVSVPKNGAIRYKVAWQQDMSYIDALYDERWLRTLTRREKEGKR